MVFAFPLEKNENVTSVNEWYVILTGAWRGWSLEAMQGDEKKTNRITFT